MAWRHQAGYPATWAFTVREGRIASPANTDFAEVPDDFPDQAATEMRKRHGEYREPDTGPTLTDRHGTTRHRGALRRERADGHRCVMSSAITARMAAPRSWWSGLRPGC
ncbi:hypothetical protein ACIRBY_25235 [Streptomyces sp. NPDC096136]|uniref:hypothetical protein n=1 Tax=Streptomyces sp. NPDC096136 TaxID=3366076 RepID=UPI003818594B